MALVTISEDKLQKVLHDVEVLIEDVASLVNQDKTAKQRLTEVKANPSIGKSEKDLDDYLKKRGIKIA
ncbi:MAG: hypothetical protein AABX98_05500 [Nanoarchaeota archaeon]